MADARLASHLLIAVVIAGAFPAVGEAKSPDISWGKAGVSFGQYRRDAVDCASEGARRDIRGDVATKGAVLGIEAQNSQVDGPRSAGTDDIDAARAYARTYQRSIRPNVDKLQAVLIGAVERCLSARGYAPFALGKDQARLLKRHRRGSDARFRYLHALAADGAIVAAQAIPMPAS